MDAFIFCFLALIVGIFLGILIAYFMNKIGGDSQKDEDFASEDLHLSQGVLNVLAVLDRSSIIVDSVDGVVRASPEAYAHSLVRGHSIMNGQLLTMIQKSRAEGTIEEEIISTGNKGDDTSIRTYLSVRVGPVDNEHILVLVEDQTLKIRTEEARNDFIANVSHELKTPVGAISLLSDALQNDLDDPKTVSKFAKKISKETKRLSLLVQDVIELSRVQGDPLLQKSEIVAVKTIVGEAIERSTLHAEDKNIILVVGSIPDVYVLGESDMLITALRNVIDNAIKYSEEKTRIGIGVKQDNHMVDIIVTDQGIGISSSEQERIFERFYRVSSDRSRKSGGSGLGLSIVKNIMNQHGGEVDVWSQLGQGATFTLSLPEVSEDIAIGEKLSSSLSQD